MDEYCCDSSYGQQACVPNLFASLATCKTEAKALGLPESNCKKLTKGTQSLNYWFVDAGGATGCIMGNAQHEVGSDHGPADRRRISWRWNKCLNGRCFTTPECP